MFISGLESIRDNLTWYYVVAVLVSIFGAFAAFVFSLKNSDEAQQVFHKDHTSRPDSEPASEQSENLVTLDDSAVKRGMKKSPALMAEMVIKANMTEEQKSLEQEIRKKQLAEIFKLMQKETDKFGDVSMLEVEEQMKLYQ